MLRCARRSAYQLMGPLQAASALVLAGLLAACGAAQSTLNDDVTASKRHFDSLLSEARAEVTAIRAEMAATRIAAAKQEAELKELRELRQQVAELGQVAESRQAELTAIRTERDRLIQAKNEMQAQVAELPRLRATAADLEKTRAVNADLESQLAMRTTELTQARQNLEQQAKLAKEHQKKLNNKAGKMAAKAKASESSSTVSPTPDALATKAASPEPALSPQTAAPGPAKLQSKALPTAPALVSQAVTPTSDNLSTKTALAAPEPVVKNEPLSPLTESGMRLADAQNAQAPPGRHTVRLGETLWQIAQRHGLTVQQLKQANGLQRDQIDAGQFLIIPLGKMME